MKALLFGGTFDPPHAGHMNNLRAAMQAVQPDVVLVTYYADCVPLYFLDPEKRVIALPCANALRRLAPRCR